MTALQDPSYGAAVWAIASAIGIAVVVAIGLLYRRARRAQDLEDAERVLAEESARWPER